MPSLVTSSPSTSPSSPGPVTPPPEFVPDTTPQVKESSESQFLYIGDSISENINIKALEVATQSDFVTAKAYSSVEDTVSNKAKQAARYPASNFTDVVHKQLGKDKFKCLILQAGSVDITNLNTKDNPEQYIEYFRQETIMSATNLFNAAVNALKVQPTLSKVVIMKHIPRYDPSNVDPLSLKPSLSILFNNTLTNLWMESPLREKLYIGTHNIECSGSIRESRYRHTKSGRFDGIHLYGSSGTKAYTLSVLNILKNAKVTSSDYDFHQSCAQFKYQGRQRIDNSWQKVKAHDRKFKRSHKKAHTSAPVPIRNRFDNLNSMNSKNC